MAKRFCVKRNGKRKNEQELLSKNVRNYTRLPFSNLAVYLDRCSNSPTICEAAVLQAEKFLKVMLLRDIARDVSFENFCNSLKLNVLTDKVHTHTQLYMFMCLIHSYVYIHINVNA